MSEYESMSNFIRAKIASGLSHNTIDSYCYALRHYYQWLVQNGIERATPADFERYMIFIKKYSAVTIRDKYAILHAYYQYCVDADIISESPIKIKKPSAPKTRVRVFTDAEVQKILSLYTVRDTFVKKRDYAIICTLLATGMRRSELLSCTDYYGDYITVMGKGSKARVIPVSSSLKSVLNDYLPDREKIAVCPNLIISKKGTPLSKDGLRAIFTKISQNTGIGGSRFSSHTFRHTFATMYLRQGDILSLQSILGHSDISTTSIYLHMSDDINKSINEKANPLNRFKKIF